MQILIASSNPHKINELKKITSGLAQAVTLAEANISDECVEVGDTLLEIAQRKAAYFSNRFAGLVVATDAGAEIPALGNNWDPKYTKRFAGEVSDFERMDRLLELAKDLKGEDRGLVWRECVAIAQRGEVLFSLEVEGDRGLLQTSYDSAKYRPGIWLCSLWFYPQFGKNFFDLTPEQIAQHGERSWVRIRSKVRAFLASVV